LGHNKLKEDLKPNRGL